MARKRPNPPDVENCKNGMWRPEEPDILKKMQKALFSPSAVKVDGKIERRPLLTLYLQKLAEAAARGSVDAHREQTWFFSYLDGKGILNAPAPVSACSHFMRERFAKQKAICDRLSKRRAPIYLMLVPEIHAAFEKSYGKKLEFELVPDYVNLQAAADELPGIVRARRRKQPKKDYEVGRGKPPVSTRWKEGSSGNPSGGQKTASDAWEPLRDAQSKELTVTADGETKTLPASAVGVRTLFDAAMKGKAHARRQVRELIIFLDAKGMLKPPEPAPARRRHRTLTDAEQRAAEDEAAFWKILITPQLKKEIWDDYTKACGPLPEFKTSFEESLPRLDDLDIFAKMPADVQNIFRTTVAFHDPEPRPEAPEPSQKPRPRKRRRELQPA